MTSIRTDCQSSIQPDFEHYQWWSIHNFFGQPSSMSLHPCYKMFLPWFNLFTLIQLKKYCSFAITDRSESQSLFISPLYILKDHFPEVFFSRLNNPNILSAFLQRTGVPLITYVALLWTCSNRSICVFTEEPRAGYLIPGQVLWEWCRVGETPSSWPAVHYFFLFLFFFLVSWHNCFSGCKCTIMAHIHFFLHQDPQILLHKNVLSNSAPSLYWYWWFSQSR